MITDEQRKFRQGKIGSSDAAAALGVSPWQTRAELYHELIGNIDRGDIGEKGLIGNWIEPVIARAYEHRTGIEVGEDLNSYKHPEHEFIVSHIDRRAWWDDKRIVELKNVGPYVANHWGEDGDPEGPPRYVLAQVVEQAAVVGVNRADVAAMFGGGELRVYPVEISEEAKEAVLGGLVLFWNDYVVPRKQPEVTGADLELLSKLYWNPNNAKEIQVEGTKTAEYFQHYREVKAKIKELTEEADQHKAAIQDFMGDAAICKRGDDMEFSWKQSKDRTRVDWERIAMEILDRFQSYCLSDGEGDILLADLIKENTKTTPGPRVFLDKMR